MATLLERDHEIGRLTQALDEAANGRGSFVLLAGEAGIGKTSLVRALRTELPDRVSFASGACEALSVPVPLAPLRELIDAAGMGALKVGSGEDRMTLAGSVLGLLAERAPILAVIEDAHWADPLTLDVLRILARRVEATGVVAVITYRDDEMGANPALGQLVGDLATSPAVRRIVLRPLSETAVSQLTAGSGLEAGRLMDATAGNPFLVVEAIAAGGRLPASVRDAALARAGRLSLAARRVVDVAAVVGQRFEAGLLNSLVDGCSDAVEEALARGVLVAEGTSLGFRHELIRAALEQSISPTRRSELHGRVFSALLAQAAETDSARLAHHAELGGLAAEAARYAAVAAGEAEQVGAVRETYLQADRALRLGHSLDQAQRFELLVQYSRAANFVNPRLQDSVDAAERAVELAAELHDDRGRGRALMALSYALWSLERVAEARLAAEEAIEAFEPTGDMASLAWAHSTLIRMEATSFDPGNAIRMAGTAIELAEEAELEEARLDIEISLGLALGHRGEQEALAVLSKALEVARRGGFTVRMVRTYVNLTTVAVALRDHELVDLVVAEALPLLDELQISPLPITAIRLHRARSLLDRGRWDEALAIAERRERWWLGEYPVGGAIEGLIKARRGEPGGESLLEESWQDMVELVSHESSRHGMIRLALVEAAWLRGDRAAAARELEAAGASGSLRFARSGGELAVWGMRLGVEVEAPDGAPAAVKFELEGDWRRAIDAWGELQSPYEAALAALPGDDRAARQAMATLHRLGGRSAAQAFARERSARGALAARKPRSSTLANPAGLTRREQQVLEALGTGASNAQIAASLHLSERTVAHHVSSILAKMGARNRHVAVEHARRRGLLAGDPR